MKISGGASIDIKPGKKIAKKAEVAKGIQSKAAIQLVKKECPEVVRELLFGLLERGEIEMPDVMPDFAEPVAGDDEFDEFDGDLPMNDEDEFVEEVPTDDSFGDFTSPFVGGSYDIVAVRRDGGVEFEAPENDWAGASWKTDDAKHVLNELSGRMRIYAEIAERLSEKFERCPDFVEDALCECLGSEKGLAAELKVDAGSLSNYLRNARVVCGDRSLPLRRLFR